MSPDSNQALLVRSADAPWVMRRAQELRLKTHRLSEQDGQGDHTYLFEGPAERYRELARDLIERQTQRILTHD